MTGHRPANLARLLLAAGARPPRSRARDQQADRAGQALQARLLEALSNTDPDPDALEITLAAIIDSAAEATGPLRALAAQFRDEWRLCQSQPAYWDYLVAEAVQAGLATSRRADGGNDCP
jgi:hypothetical protein